MQETYLFQKLLQKISGLKFKTNSLHHVELSQKGKKQANTYYRKKKPITTLSPSPKQLDDEKKGYLQYQKEIAAVRHMDTQSSPKPPGRIVKLPVLFQKK